MKLKPSETNNIFDTLKGDISFKYELYHSGGYAALKNKFGSMLIRERETNAVRITTYDLYEHHTSKGVYVYKCTISCSIDIEYSRIRMKDKAYLARCNITETSKNEILIRVQQRNTIKFERTYSSTMLGSIQNVIKIFDDTMHSKFNITL